MSEPLVIAIPGPPVPKARPKFFRKGSYVGSYTPRPTLDYEARVRYCVTSAMSRERRELFVDAISVTLECTMPIPASWSQRKKDHAALGSIMPATKPDLDNIAKSILDAANGHAWRDDAQIVELIIRKRYGTPGVVMTVRPWVTAAEMAA